MFPRSIKNELSYYRYKRTKPSGCAFCEIDLGQSSQVIKRTDRMAVLRNMFPYARWDGRKVTDHLMIVPVNHVISLNKLDAVGSRELLDLVTEYEDDGYSFYIRSPHNKSRTIPHIHGHLIRLR